MLIIRSSLNPAGSSLRSAPLVPHGASLGLYLSTRPTPSDVRLHGTTQAQYMCPHRACRMSGVI
eukprot:4065022-Prymnesium_polylepis.1